MIVCFQVPFRNQRKAIVAPRILDMGKANHIPVGPRNREAVKATGTLITPSVIMEMAAAVKVFPEPLNPPAKALITPMNPILNAVYLKNSTPTSTICLSLVNTDMNIFGNKNIITPIPVRIKKRYFAPI